MNRFQFKTNIQCAGCLARVQPVLDAEKNIASWTVDTADPRKLLTVTTSLASEAEVVELVAKAGYRAEALNES